MKKRYSILFFAFIVLNCFSQETVKNEVLAKELLDIWIETHVSDTAIDYTPLKYYSFVPIYEYQDSNVSKVNVSSELITIIESELHGMLESENLAEKIEFLLIFEEYDIVEQNNNNEEYIDSTRYNLLVRELSKFKTDFKGYWFLHDFEYTYNEERFFKTLIVRMNKELKIIKAYYNEDPPSEAMKLIYNLQE